MAHLLLLVKGSGGDLYPFIYMGRLLQSCGHEITLLSHGYYADTAIRAGLGFAALDTLEAFQQMAADQPMLNTPSGTVAFYRRHIMPPLIQEYKTVCDCCHSGEAVLIAHYDAYLLALLATEKQNLPFISVVPSPSYLAGLPVLEGLYHALAADINRVRAELGLPALSNWGRWLGSAKRFLGLWPDWYAPLEPTWPREVALVGFLLDDGASAGALPAQVLEFLESGPAPVLITHGTSPAAQPEFFALGVEACRLAGRRGLLVTRQAALVPRHLPDDIRWFDSLPFATLMPRMEAVIHHGGIGTLAQALAAGVPQLVLASGFDRPDNATRLQRLGVAEHLPPSCWKPAAAVEALRRLLESPDVRERCIATRERFLKGCSDAALSEAIQQVITSAGVDWLGGTAANPKSLP